MQAAHNGAALNCRALMLSHAAVLYLALKACRSIVGALLGVCASQYLLPFTFGALHWYSSHCGRGIVGIQTLSTTYPHKANLSTDVQDVGLTYTQVVSLV